MIKDLKLGFRIIRTVAKHERWTWILPMCFLTIGLLMELVGGTGSLALGGVYLAISLVLFSTTIQNVMVTGMGSSSPLNRRICTRVMPLMTFLLELLGYVGFLVLRVGRIVYFPDQLNGIDIELWKMGIVIVAMFMIVCNLFGVLLTKSTVAGVIEFTVGLLVCITMSTAGTFLYDRLGPWNVTLKECLIVGVGLVILSSVIQAVLARTLYFKDTIRSAGTATAANIK